jgi:hypothetical protein
MDKVIWAWPVFVELHLARTHNHNTTTITFWKGLSVRPEPPVFKLLPQRAGFRLAKKLVVFDVAPANRDLVELVPLAPVGVDRPELPSDVAETNGNSP